jgi:hypothetical protein
MTFDPDAYGPGVAAILALGEGGGRPMPLAIAGCTSVEARRLLAGADARKLLPDAFAPEAALSGLWLYFGCFEESHGISQDIHTVEGSYWHGILHRQEPDPGNASYWFRRVGRHPIFSELRAEAAAVPALARGTEWDPFAFINFCERARRTGGEDEAAARRIQLVEWQLLFDYCARPRRNAS